MGASNSKARGGGVRRKVAPSGHTSGTHNASLNSAAQQEQMLAQVMEGKNSSEEIVASQITQAIKGLHIASNAGDEPDEVCGFEAAEVHDKNKGRDSLPMKEEEVDDCPICLEGFDVENPKLVIQCKHFYHLSCMLEWTERSATCPICGEVAIFDEPS